MRTPESHLNRSPSHSLHAGCCRRTSEKAYLQTSVAKARRFFGYSLIFGMILTCLLIPASALAQSDWDVTPQREAPNTSWDGPARDTRASDASWDVTPSKRPTSGTTSDPTSDAAQRAQILEELQQFESGAERPDRQQRAYQASVTPEYDRQRFTLRLTPWTGINETISVSLAWTKPDFFELEGGLFLNPMARMAERRTETLPDAEVLEWSVSRRVLEKGFYLRGSIAYPLFDQRGVRMRPWHADLLIPLELRVPIRRDEWTVLAALHVGAEFTRWFTSGRGLSLGGLVGAPFWDLRARRSLGFRPIVRFHVGLAF